MAVVELKDLVTFRSIRPYIFDKRVLGYYLPSPFEVRSIADLDYLFGRQILIDDQVYQCNSIEIEERRLPLEKGDEFTVWVTRVLKK